MGGEQLTGIGKDVQGKGETGTIGDTGVQEEEGSYQINPEAEQETVKPFKDVPLGRVEVGSLQEMAANGLKKISTDLPGVSDQSSDPLSYVSQEEVMANEGFVSVPSLLKELIVAAHDRVVHDTENVRTPIWHSISSVFEDNVSLVDDISGDVEGLRAMSHSDSAIEEFVENAKGKVEWYIEHMVQLRDNVSKDLIRMVRFKVPTSDLAPLILVYAMLKNSLDTEGLVETWEAIESYEVRDAGSVTPLVEPKDDKIIETEPDSETGDENPYLTGLLQSWLEGREALLDNSNRELNALLFQGAAAVTRRKMFNELAENGDRKMIGEALVEVINWIQQNVDHDLQGEVLLMLFGVSSAKAERELEQGEGESAVE